jgi:hypothetical protein
MAKHGTKVKHGNGTRNPTLHVDGISPPHFGRFVQSVHIKNVGKGQGWERPPPPPARLALPNMHLLNR